MICFTFSLTVGQHNWMDLSQRFSWAGWYLQEIVSLWKIKSRALHCAVSLEYADSLSSPPLNIYTSRSSLCSLAAHWCVWCQCPVVFLLCGEKSLPQGPSDWHHQPALYPTTSTGIWNDINVFFLLWLFPNHIVFSATSFGALSSLVTAISLLWVPMGVLRTSKEGRVTSLGGNTI